jgi:hypothetical protein
MMTALELLELTQEIPSNYNLDMYEQFCKYIPELAPGNFVDFGTCWGRSAIAASLLNPNLIIHTFDNNCNHTENYESRAKAYLDKFSRPGAINFSIDDSRNKKWDAPLVGLSIDSSHTYEDTRDEINKWVRFLVPGGVVFFDDYLVPRCGVKQAVDEFFDNNSSFYALNKGMCAVYLRTE